MGKILSESLYEFRKINKVETTDLLLEELNEGLNSKQQAVLDELVGKSELTSEDIQKYGKFMDKVMDVFKISQPGTKGADLALKYRKMIKADKAKYAPYVLKFLKTFKEGAADKGKAKLFSFDPAKKTLAIRLGNVGKSAVGSELGQ